MTPTIFFLTCEYVKHNDKVKAIGWSQYQSTDWQLVFLRWTRNKFTTAQIQNGLMKNYKLFDIQKQLILAIILPKIGTRVTISAKFLTKYC